MADFGDYPVYPIPQEAGTRDVLAQLSYAQADALQPVRIAIANALGEAHEDQQKTVRKLERRITSLVSKLHDTQARMVSNFEQQLGQRIATLSGEQDVITSSVRALAGPEPVNPPGQWMVLCLSPDSGPVVRAYDPKFVGRILATFPTQIQAQQYAAGLRQNNPGICQEQKGAFPGTAPAAPVPTSPIAAPSPTPSPTPTATQPLGGLGVNELSTIVPNFAVCEEGAYPRNQVCARDDAGRICLYLSLDDDINKYLGLTAGELRNLYLSNPVYFSSACERFGQTGPLPTPPAPEPKPEPVPPSVPVPDSPPAEEEPPITGPRTTFCDTATVARADCRQAGIFADTPLAELCDQPLIPQMEGE